MKIDIDLFEMQREDQFHMTYYKDSCSIQKIKSTLRIKVVFLWYLSPSFQKISQIEILLRTRTRDSEWILSFDNINLRFKGLLILVLNKSDNVKFGIVRFE